MSSRIDGAGDNQLQHIHENAWISPSTQIYGKISVGDGSSLWHNVVTRAECHEITIGRMTNVQDFVMIHVGFDDPTHIGDFCSIAHHATLQQLVLGTVS